MQRIIPFIIKLFLLNTIFLLTACYSENTTLNNRPFDWQGHRGARGLLPENSIAGFLKALDYKVNTLELDVVISADKKVIVSHDPWFSHHICSSPDGIPIIEENEKECLIYELNYAEIKKFDCGSRGNSKFPDQISVPTYKPNLGEVFTKVKEYCVQNKIGIPFFNIEIKSRPSWDNIYTPSPDSFAKILINEIESHKLSHKCTVQSFDIRSLQAVKKIAPRIKISYLIENINTLEKNIELLGFVPDVYSPYYLLVTDILVKKVHRQGILLIPWTVNDKDTMKKLIQLGVDGIITDYPNLIIDH